MHLILEDCSSMEALAAQGSISRRCCFEHPTHGQACFGKPKVQCNAKCVYRAQQAHHESSYSLCRSFIFTANLPHALWGQPLSENKKASLPIYQGAVPLKATLPWTGEKALEFCSFTVLSLSYMCPVEILCEVKQWNNHSLRKYTIRPVTFFFLNSFLYQ